jgi:PPOX class probable F420-dependent enzyme
MLSWPEVEQRLVDARNYWVATTRADGGPHVMPVWGLWIDGTFAFSTDPGSVKGRNLARDPRVAVHLESGDDAVILEGTVERITTRPDLERFADAYQVKYRMRPDVSQPESSSSGYYRLRLDKAIAWREQDFPTSATRWLFTGGNGRSG